jgi:hypothetical protein
MESISILQDGLIDEAAADPRPTAIQIRDPSTFLSLNSIRWYATESIIDTSDSSQDVQEDGTEVEVGQAGMTLGRLSTGTSTSEQAGGDGQESSLSVWSAAIKSDASGLIARKGHVLYRLTSAIILEIERGMSESDGKLSGKEVKWMSGTLAAEKERRLGEAGYSKLRTVRGFTRESVMDSYWSMGVSTSLRITKNPQC